jgi:hypothetical protein
MASADLDSCLTVGWLGAQHPRAVHFLHMPVAYHAFVLLSCYWRSIQHLTYFVYACTH